MSNTVNMNLALPTPGGDDGVWDTELNAALTVIDAHDHTPGKGLLIPTAGLNLNTDVPFNNNKATELKAAQFQDAGTAPTGISNANQVQTASGDLWFTNGSGVAVQITSGASTVAPATSNTPPGIVLPYAGSSAPAGYLLCDGTAVSRVTYSALFAVIGTAYGAGDTTTTFNLPNTSGRVPMGAGTYTDSVSGSVTRTLAQQIGAEKHVLVLNELASHNHGGGSHSHSLHVNNIDGTLGDYNASGARNTGDTLATEPPIDASGTIINTEGANVAHNNMQPSLGFNFIIKT